MIFEMSFPVRLHKTVGVRVGRVQVGGGAPVAVQSMTLTETADAAATARQCVELAEAGSELVRITVNTPEAARAVPEIKQRMLDAGCEAPLIGDFHYNGHLLLTRFPDAARALDRLDQSGQCRRENVVTSSSPRSGAWPSSSIAPFASASMAALNQELVMAKIGNTDSASAFVERSSTVMVLSALQSTELALETDFAEQIISARSPGRDLMAVYRDLARRTDQPLHLGLTEAEWASRIVGPRPPWPSCSTKGSGHDSRLPAPRPGGDRREEYAACEILQSLGLRSFAPSITACPGCAGRRRRRSRSWPNGFRLRAHDDAGLEADPAGRRVDVGRRDGMRRQRTGRIESRQHRHLAAGHGRVAELQLVFIDGQHATSLRHLRRTGRRLSAARRRACSERIHLHRRTSSPHSRPRAGRQSQLRDRT
jgi:(E)-4-hydroxy-3-methylbut-2-enyl-diphosphate synthase